jgi:hypothetical protein
MAETPYTETEALLAVMNEDDERLSDLLGEMTHNELTELRSQTYSLFRACSNAVTTRRVQNPRA